MPEIPTAREGDNAIQKQSQNTSKRGDAKSSKKWRFWSKKKYIHILFIERNLSIKNVHVLGTG